MKTPSESNSPSSSSLSALSDSANSKDDSDSSQKNKSGNNLLVISVMPGGQPSLNSEEKPEKGKGAGGLAHGTRHLPPNSGGMTPCQEWCWKQILGPGTFLLAWSAPSLGWKDGACDIASRAVTSFTQRRREQHLEGCKLG